MNNTSNNFIKIRSPISTIVFNCTGCTLLIFLSLICVLPFLLLISASLTAEKSIIIDGFRLIPKVFSSESYSILFRNPATILRAYGVSIFVTAVGSALGLFITSATAYVLSRKYFKFRTQITFFFYFTTLFSGGLLSSYIFFVRYLNLKNSYLALILPLMINVFYLLIMRTFMAAIPESICESAKIDGANEIVIFLRLFLPLSTAALATIGLFLILDYWNNWYYAMLYLSKTEMFPLQYMLYNMMSTAEAMKRISEEVAVDIVNIPTRSLRMAMAVVATGPILFVYPFVQKYFVKGVTLGAVKG